MYRRYDEEARERGSTEASREQDLAVRYADSIADNHPPRTVTTSNLIDL